MKNYKIQEQKYVVKLSGFLLLLFIVVACNMSQNSDKPKTESNKSETESNKPEKTEKKDTAGIEKLKTQAKPKNNEKSAFSSTTEDLKHQVCRKYDECGSQDYEECIEQAADLYYDDEVWACMLDSSCESLREGKPDACMKAKNNQGTVVPDVPNCYGTTCTRNSDCPGGCHGGCSEGRCYLF
jgi:hypothetical protein